MNISVSYYSDIGGRDQNEDAVALLEQNGTVFGVVADGLGGHDSGELASARAIQIISSGILQCPVSPKLLRQVIEEANLTIWKAGKGRGMKTTVSALWFDDLGAVAANVGDTRIYQFRDGKIIFQSRDHSVAQLSVLAGDLQPEDVRASRQRHQLTRALGGQEEVKVDISSLQIRKKDAFLICSDGFWEKIEEPEMAEDLRDSRTAGDWIHKMKYRMAERHFRFGDNHSAIAILIR